MKLRAAAVEFIQRCLAYHQQRISICKADIVTHFFTHTIGLLAAV
ncbi:Uncharacterised protein [Vibrio cholerae]|nr:Uncharacterised protein [Vibrio cholerae]